MANTKDWSKDISLQLCLSSERVAMPTVSVPLSLWLTRLSALRDWEGEASLDFRSPAFTELHLRYQEDRNSMSSSAASPAIGTVGLDLETEGDRSFKCNLYFQPQVSPGDEHTREQIRAVTFNSRQVF